MKLCYMLLFMTLEVLHVSRVVRDTLIKKNKQKVKQCKSNPLKTLHQIRKYINLKLTFVFHQRWQILHIVYSEIKNDIPRQSNGTNNSETLDSCLFVHITYHLVQCLVRTSSHSQLELWFLMTMCIFFLLLMVM